MLRKIKLKDVLSFIPQKHVFVRADFNTPIKDGKVGNNKRIVETLPTIKKILENNPKGVVLASHLGRPDGKAKPEFSLKPVKEELENLLQAKVKFAPDCVSEEARQMAKELNNGEILLLENLRFYPEEEGSSINEKGEKVKADKEKVKEFRKKLQSMGNLYVNDAFGTSHRAHSSIVGFECPIRAPGLLMEKELAFFGKALESPERPLTIILGGAKVSDKLPLIKNLIKLGNDIIIGGAMAFTFLKESEKMKIGGSLFDAEGAKLVNEILNEAKTKGVRIHLPVDFIASKDLKDTSGLQTFEKSRGIDDGWKGFDIGPKSIDNFKKVIENSKTVIMNGPMGVFETEAFAKGSQELVKTLVNITEKNKALTIVGGGDTVSMVSKVKGASKAISHVSTGGGASLELLEGKKLPGVEHLTNKEELEKMKV